MTSEVTFTDTSEVKLVNAMGSDITVVQAAVVSTGVNIDEWPADRINGLIHRLMKDRHGAPFEHVTFSFVIRTPLFTARQLMRHRISSFNETSGRYRELPPVFYVPPVDRPIVQVGKAMDYEMVPDAKIRDTGIVILEQSCMSAYRSYQQLLELGWAKEIARTVLPVNIMTELMLSINLRSLFNLLSLRGKGQGLFPSHPQYEITVVSEKIELEIERLMPIAHKAFVENGRVQP